MEEGAGERRRVFLGDSPLPSPLPARASRGEEEDSRSPETLIQRQCTPALSPGERESGRGSRVWPRLRFWMQSCVALFGWSVTRREGRRPLQFPRSVLAGERECRSDLGGLGRLFGFGGDILALEVTFAAMPLLHFIALLAHKSLYIAEPFRILGRAL